MEQKLFVSENLEDLEYWELKINRHLRKGWKVVPGTLVEFGSQYAIVLERKMKTKSKKSKRN